MSFKLFEITGLFYCVVCRKYKKIEEKIDPEICKCKDCQKEKAG